MNAPASFSKPRYPGKVAIRHAIETARALGLDVAGFEVSPDGTIRILEARTLPQQPMNDFDRLENEL
jgi:hypothetical protein